MTRGFIRNDFLMLLKWPWKKGIFPKTSIMSLEKIVYKKNNERSYDGEVETGG
jgi:hypothetical protein